MTVIEFLDKKGWKYVIKGDEALVETCPFCGHKNEFNVNIKTGAYICNRQNNCGARGFFKLDNFETKKEPQTLEITQDMFDTLSSSQLQYLKSRGISKKTAVTARVLNRKGVLCFFYTNAEGKPIGIKYRTIPREGEKKKIWSEKDSEMLLLNWDRVPKDAERLYITEGEMDMMSLLEIGVKNVVSVPNGTKSLEWIEKQYEWLERFKEIILCLDNDKAGQDAIKEITTRLSDTKAELKTVDLIFYKDANEVLQDEDGATKLKNIIENNIKDLEIQDILLCSEVKAESERESIDWQDQEFNRLTGGLRYGEVLVFTGNSGCGKSTFVNNLMANLLNSGHKVYTHQGEFSPGAFKNNLYKIFCRPADIETYKNELKGKVYGRISRTTEKKIDEWLGDKLIINGSQVPTKKQLLKTMEKVYKRMGVKIFFIDNLMTVGIEGDDKYEEQKKLFLDLQEFAKKYNVFIGIVAHAKKNNTDFKELDQYIIHGASEIANLSNYIIFLHRLSKEEMEKLEQGGLKASTGGICLKDRAFGDIKEIGYWDYEIKTGRFLNILDRDRTLNKKYNWETYKEMKKFVNQEFPF